MFLADKFNLDSFNALVTTPIEQNDTGILLQRHLTAVNPKILEKKYPKLVFDTLNLHIDNTGGYAQYLQSLRTDVQGGYADKGDASGKVSITLEDNLMPVRLRETLVRWDHDKVQEAKIGNFNIVDKQFAGVLQVYNQEIDTVAIVGLDTNKRGLSNNQHYPTEAAGSFYLTLTAVQQYDLIADFITQQHNGVNNTPEYSANICLLPTLIFNSAQRRILNEFNNGTVMHVLKQNFPTVTFLHTAKLITEMVIFSSDESAVAFRIPVPMEFSPILVEHFDFSTKSKYRIGGIDVLEPASGQIVTALVDTP
jgi:hypothetical protein